MTFNQPQTLKTIAEIIGAQMIGDDHFPVLGTNEIHRVKSGEIVFVNHPKYYDKALNSEATIILIDKEVDCPPGKALLVSDDPFRDFNKINTHFTKIYNVTDELHEVRQRYFGLFDFGVPALLPLEIDEAVIAFRLE